jgi:hypothetical protein
MSLSLLMLLRLRTELQRYLNAKSDSLLLEKLRSRVYSLDSCSRKGDPSFIDFSVISLFIRFSLNNLRGDTFETVFQN